MNMKYLKYKEVAQLLGIHISLVRKYVYAGRLGKRLPTGYIITPEDVKDFDKIPRNPGQPKKLQKPV